jgi:hypothetical protein
MTATKVSDAIGRGVQLFRVRAPRKHFVELTELSPMFQLCIGRRRVWKAKKEEAWYALLTIPFKDEEEILVRAPGPNWEEWDWQDLVSQADACRWRGPNLDPRYVI